MRTIFQRVFMLAVFVLILGLPLVVRAQESLPAKEEIKVPVSTPATEQVPINIDIEGEKPIAPPVSSQELRDFANEFRNLQQEVSQLLKQMIKVKGTEEWQSSLKEVKTIVSDCLNKIKQATADEQREVIDECRGERHWDTMNEIREEFVPPQEIKNVLNEIKKQTQDLNRFKKQLAKMANMGDSLQLVAELLAKLEVFKNNILQAVGRDQREAMRDFYDAQLWEELDKIRARVELPREMKNVVKDLKIVLKMPQNRNYLQAYKFFGVEVEKLKSNLDARQAVVDQINAFVSQGNLEEAYLILREEIHEGWHPGDVRHFSDLLRDGYRALKGLRDAEIKEQVLVIVSPIIDSFNAGDYREAKDALIQFMDELRKYERIFRPYYQGAKEMDTRTQDALDKLDNLIQEKLKGGGGIQEKEKTMPAMPAPAPGNEPG